jgi:hypothetical protein
LIRWNVKLAAPIKSPTEKPNDMTKYGVETSGELEPKHDRIKPKKGSRGGVAHATRRTQP